MASKTFKIKSGNSAGVKVNLAKFVAEYDVNVADMPPPVTLTREAKEEGIPLSRKERYRLEKMKVTVNDPLILEDAEQTCCFRGTPQFNQPKNNRYVILVQEGDCFRAISTEEFYTFRPKLKGPSLTLEEAEEQVGIPTKTTEGQAFLT